MTLEGKSSVQDIIRLVRKSNWRSQDEYILHLWQASEDSTMVTIHPVVRLHAVVRSIRKFGGRLQHTADGYNQF